jgi:hypothetical protein
MRFFTSKEKKNKLIFFLIFGMYSVLGSLNVKAQKLLFKDCYPENNIDSLRKSLMFNQTSTDVERLKNLIKLDLSFHFKYAIFEKLDEIKSLSDKLNNNLGLSYYYFMKAFFLPYTSVNDANENLRLGHLYLEKTDDLKLKQFCHGIELLYYFNIERTTTDGKFPKSKAIFYDKIELNENQYNLLNEFQKVDYLLLVCSFELEIHRSITLKYKKYIDEMEYITKKYSKTKYAKSAFSLFTILYYDVNGNYDKAILKCKESLEGLDASDVLFKSRMHYTLANIYVKTNQLEMALTNYRNALFYFNAIEKYDYSPLAAGFKIISFQIAISNFFKTRYKLTNNNLTTSSKANGYFNPMQLDINSMLGLLLSQIEKEKNSILTKRNDTLQVQKIQQELLYRSSELAKTKIEIQRLKALEEVANQRNENIKLFFQNSQKKYIIIVISIVMVLLSYFLIRLRKLNRFIKEDQINKDRFFALFSHDLRGVIVNLKDSGEVLNYLIKNHRFDEIQEISKQLDLDGCNALLLLNNMLDWGTLNGYSYQPRYENFILSNKVWDIISIYKSAIDSKNIKLNIEIENNLSIYSDEKSIDVVLRNIIANAKSYTPEGGNISIRLEKDLSNQIAFIVTNSVSEFKRGKLVHIQNILSGKKRPKTGHHGIGLGIVLIHEYAKNCHIKLELSFENNIVTFKALF